MSPTTETKRLVGRRGEKARAAYLEAARKYIAATTPDQRIRAEAACRKAAQGIDPSEVTALTAAASRAIGRA